ncbi:C4-dicarboxylate ABC transporter substrate-binding protein [Elstera cyanobacteriorum]|uniref:C4-dicarboxylate ABC transporter substrate-binding protein n=1 Tax=Elstera cyanobacteriorum TaxID=2022747 RepID=A0A255XIP8_9PROT|nr:tripartite tricarboxylate transporter substrate-binding protein [Elstera cyanobacteriorum]OYQ16761.1 C4-dicarboxylate ABC transporter substrate-binding protein [Elstera cyanobacteriorum]GFZ88416.1 C4-dicarboxylate ABC transporter substrate-binding protein [Elstera cyanobacteriorum]
MLNRRQMLMMSGAAALLPLIGTPAFAQQMKQVRFFVPAAPGGGWDQTARTMEQVLRTANLVGSTQVTNVGGAGGTVGLPQFINQWKGQGDGLMVSGLVMMGAIIANKTPFNLTNVTPIARLTGEAEVIVVPKESPLKTLKDLAAALKADVAKVTWAGGSAGGTDHIIAALVAQAVGADPTKISYVAYAGGGPAQAALLGNQVTCGISGLGEFVEQIKAGNLRALGISSDKRIPGLDVPTFKESGVDVEFFNWRGVFAPPGVSADQKKAMIDLVTAMNKSQAWQDELKKRDWTDIFLAGDAFEAFIKTETERVTDTLKKIGLA